MRRYVLLLCLMTCGSACDLGRQRELRVTSTDTALLDSARALYDSLDAASYGEDPFEGGGVLADSSEIGIRTLEIGIDSSVARSLLGTPDAVRTDPFTLTPATFTSTWTYNHATLEFDSTGRLRRVQVRDSRLSTLRGLRVGDVEAKMQELYGIAPRVLDHVRDYRWAGNHLLVIRAGIVDGRVQWLIVGWLDE